MNYHSRLYKPRCVMCREVVRGRRVGVQTEEGLLLCWPCRRMVEETTRQLLHQWAGDDLPELETLEREDYL
jgi:hypothetical protein